MADHKPARRPGIARLPVHFFVIAVFSFATATALLPFLVDGLMDYFYGPYELALVHTFTLGWVTAAIMGVTYRYVPALTRRTIRYPRLAFVQMVTFVVGATGLAVHFALGIWFATWLAAAVVLASVMMFAANVMPCLFARMGKGAAETGIFLGECFLILAATWGFLAALDKDYNFLPGSLLTNLAIHVSLAAVGWVTLTICAVSYRLIPAFILPTIKLPREALWQLWVLAAGTAAMVLMLLGGLAGAGVFGAAMVLAILWYVTIIVRLMRARRMALDWMMRHAAAATGWLVVTGALAVAVAPIGADSRMGAGLALACGVAALLGWISNFIIGFSYQLFPGMVARARALLGWPTIRVPALSIHRVRPLVFISWNTGVLLLAGGSMLGLRGAAAIGALAVFAGGSTYSATMLWTLTWGYRRSIPHAPTARA